MIPLRPTSPARSESEEGERERIRRERESHFDRETIRHLSQTNEELKTELANEIARSNEMKVMFYALQQQLEDMVDLQGEVTCRYQDLIRICILERFLPLVIDAQSIISSSSIDH